MACTDIGQALSAVSTVLMVVFTGGLVWVGARQARIMKTQAAIQDLTLAATETAARAATKSADAVEKSVTDLERPYILVEKIVSKIKECMDGPLPSPERPSAILSLKHYGRSPALVTELKLSLADSPDSPFGVPVIPLNNIVVVGQNETLEYACRYDYPVRGEGERSQIQKGEIQFWLCTSICYDDMLGRPRQTQVRFRYEPKEDKFLMMHGDSYTIRT